MLSVINEPAKKEGIQYPCLMECVRHYCGPFVVLATGPNKGFVIWTDNTGNSVGEYAEDWLDFDKDTWKPFDGKISLRNT